MFVLSQFTYNAFRFVELNLHKWVSLLWKTSWMWQETGVWKKYIYYYYFFLGGGGAIGISPRASNWLETAMDSALPFAFSRRPYDPRNASTLQNISVCPACCVLKSCRGDIMSQSLSLSLCLCFCFFLSYVPKCVLRYRNLVPNDLMRIDTR